MPVQDLVCVHPVHNLFQCYQMTKPFLQNRKEEKSNFL